MEAHAYGAWSVVPPLVAIALALKTRQVIPSLLAGIWAGWCITAGGNPWSGTTRTLDCLVGVFAEPWRVKVLLFTLAVGSLLILLQSSGGVEGFVRHVSRWSWSRSRRGAQLMAWVIGLGVFIESNITCLVVGTVARPLFDRLRISRERLAYICDSTSAPVCMLLPINGWGAVVLGLLATQAEAGLLGDQSPLGVFLRAVPLNAYAWLSVLLVLVTILTGRDIGPLRAAERRAREEGKLLRDGARPVVTADVLQERPSANVEPLLRNMLVPLVVLVLAVPLGILRTGWVALPPQPDDIQLWSLTGLLKLLDHASGSTAVFWGVCLAFASAAGMTLVQRIHRLDEVVQLSLKGAGGLMPLAVIMALAFALGMTCTELETGRFVAQAVSPHLPASLVAPTVFLVSGIIAFSTGTSWGTFAIMIPLAVPLAAAGVEGADGPSLALVVSAVLGGGVFGDH